LAQEPGTHPVSTLTAEEFLKQVESAEPAVAVFDCDGTIWGGDAGVGFMRWSMDSGLLSREACDWIDTRYRGYLRGEVSELAICGEMVQIYRDLRETELRQAVHIFFEKTIRPQIFPEISELLERLRKKGVTLWAVSSTNNWLIEDAVRDFGIPAERVLATCVRVTNGLITEELLDVPTDEGKAASLARHGVTHPDAVFGNSIHDAAMLAVARYPFAVNPTIALSELAATQGWAVFQPRSQQQHA
jgi:phosphoserine phosphatase